MMLHAIQNSVIEWSYASTKVYEDPFHDLEIDVVFTEPEGVKRKVPAFWAGEQNWVVRYASPVPGRHHFRTVCSDADNADLNGCEGEIEIAPYDGNNPLYRHGPLRVHADRHHLEHVDGTPFFWLGDTWWMLLCKRWKWPEDLRTMVADRRQKGFSVIQVVAGLYPDMPPFDERGANEAGFPWTTDYGRINPDYFDMADLRIGYLVQSGLTPCIVGFWGYFLAFAGAEVLKKHWRYLIARWGAYPVVWCTAGEGLMPFYTARNETTLSHEYQNEIRAVWSDMARYIRSVDGYGRPVTIHPTSLGHDQVDDPGVLDIDMLQTGHIDGRASTIDWLTDSLEMEPKMPVLIGEVGYEGMLESNREEFQRFFFWSSMLSGAMGFTYGANGIWQINRRGKPFGPSPHGNDWGDLPWDDAYLLPGSTQVAMGKNLLERYPWWEFEPHPEWVEPHHTRENRLEPYAAGIPGKVRLVYIPFPRSGDVRLRHLETCVKHRCYFFDPKSGTEVDRGHVEADANGDFAVQRPSLWRDWVLVLECGR